MDKKKYDELYNRIRKNWDKLAKPIDGLGEFEKVLSKIGAVQGDECISLDPAALLVFISDNGIVDENISQSTSEVTYEVAKALGKGTSTVCHMAKNAGLTVYPVNVGMKNAKNIEGVENRCTINGTDNFMNGPAMTYENMFQAMNNGRLSVRKLNEAGIKIIALGEMGIGNTTTSAAVLAGLLKLDGSSVCSRGAGLSDEGLQRKVQVVDKAIKKYDLYSMKPLDILTSVGGFDIAALTGAILECYELSIPVVIDGFITGVAALLAKYINDDIDRVLVFSHRGREGGMKYVLDEFGVEPVISADMALGEGTGACVFMAAAKCALSVYTGGTLFRDINIDEYKRFT